MAANQAIEQAMERTSPVLLSPDHNYVCHVLASRELDSCQIVQDAADCLSEDITLSKSVWLPNGEFILWNPFPSCTPTLIWAGYLYNTCHPFIPIPPGNDIFIVDPEHLAPVPILKIVFCGRLYT